MLKNYPIVDLSVFGLENVCTDLKFDIGDELGRTLKGETGREREGELQRTKTIIFFFAVSRWNNDFCADGTDNENICCCFIHALDISTVLLCVCFLLLATLLASF